MLLTNIAQFFSAAAVIGSGSIYKIEPWKTYLIMVVVSMYGMLVNLFWEQSFRKV